jgi:F0F1-type ATP synthase membrane subunit c/vacuolar-type H+-ATPase subunit K
MKKLWWIIALVLLIAGVAIAVTGDEGCEAVARAANWPADRCEL